MTFVIRWTSGSVGAQRAVHLDYEVQPVRLPFVSPPLLLLLPSAPTPQTLNPRSWYLYNRDYPDFYTRLYALCDRSVLHVKYRSRFFRLAETFLASSFVLPSPLPLSSSCLLNSDGRLTNPGGFWEFCV